MGVTLPTEINITKKQKCPVCKKLFLNSGSVKFDLTATGTLRLVHSECFK